ncbi:MAG: hypothetical protein HPY50_10135 [Firmicutes bacterium]|nr:hypothetical protein [Bacillota bacterium]
MVDRYTLSETSKWAGLAGILTIILGALLAFCGLFAFIIGALPGVIVIIMGVMLRKAKQRADDILMTQDPSPEKLSLMLQSLNSYLKITFIYAIVMIALSLLSLLASLIMGIAMFSAISSGF